MTVEAHIEGFGEVRPRLALARARPRNCLLDLRSVFSKSARLSASGRPSVASQSGRTCSNERRMIQTARLI